MRDHVSGQVQAEVKNFKGDALGSTQTEKGEPDTEAWRVREDVRRANAALHPVSPGLLENEALSQMGSGLLETDPKHTREEPSRAPDATWSGIE